MAELDREYPSLRARLIGMLALFAALFLGLTAYLYFSSRSIFADALERELTGDSDWMVAQISADPGLLENSSRTDSLCSAVAKYKGFRVTVIDTTGRVLADSHVPRAELSALENHRNRPEVQDALAGGWGHSWRHSSTLSTEMLYVARLLPKHKGYLRLAAGPVALNSFQNASLRVFALFLGLFLAASAAVTAWISRKISDPLLQLMKDRSAEASWPAGASPPRWEAEFREAEVLNRAFQGYVDQIRKLGGDVESERDKLVAILNQLEEGILILSGDGVVLAANPSSLTLLGLEPRAAGALAEGSPNDAASPGSKVRSARGRPACVGQSAEKVLKQKSLIHWVRDAALPDRPPFLHIDKGVDSPFDLLCHLAALESSGGAREYLLTVIDVTEFRHLDRVKSEFVANASHELKTPLSSIKGYAEALLEGALNDAKVRGPFVTKIHANALRLERLIQDLLNLSQLEANPVPKEIEALPLRGYVNAAANLYRDNLEAAGIRLENHVPEDLRVLMEPRDLELILNNLVGNAVKYNRPGGKVKVGVETSSVKLFVKDTGIGIPAEMLPRIFERFYRADASRARKDGTGLGLAIVKHAAAKYGIAVGAESVLGEGSRFVLDLGKVVEVT